MLKMGVVPIKQTKIKFIKDMKKGKIYVPEFRTEKVLHFFDTRVFSDLSTTIGSITSRGSPQRRREGKQKPPGVSSGNIF
jgi:hypothetical protein